MKCPGCGSELSATGGGCPVCKTLPSAPLAAVLAPGLSSDDSDTGLPFPVAALTPDDEPTRPADTTGLPTVAAGVRHVAPGRKETGPLQVGEQFSARYLIVRLLGIGGMGAVYQSWDAELSVMVALKVVRPEVTRDPDAAREIERRFKQELLLARQVTHKNVVRIHDMGEIGGIKYITMPYIEGQDLATVLKQSSQLPVESVMPIARQIAEGLQAAHEAGIVHRDLKPANIMLEKGGQAIIMDFGIARTAARQDGRLAGTGPAGQIAANLSEDVTRAAATMAGAVVGTIGYMAPEQARGEEVDQRADIYAFGLMIYDMLAGRHRIEHAPSALEELRQRLVQPPPRIRTIVPAVPEALDRVVSQCVEPDAEKRFKTTTELVAALDRLTDAGTLRPVRRVVGLPLMAATVVLLVSLAAGTLWYQRQFIPPPQRDPVSVVIADFANSTGDAAFDGTLEPTLRRGLEAAGFITAYDRGAIRTLGVPAPVAMGELAAREIAVKQGVGVVVSGSIARQGNGYQVSVKAFQAVTGNVIAEEQVRAPSKEQVLASAARLVASVRTALGDDASESDQLFAMASMSATSLDVIGHYAAGREAASTNRYEEAKRSYLEAVELDPKFGIGYQALAAVSLNLGEPEEATKYVNEALRHLDGMTQREVYSVRGLFYLTTGDYPQCVKEYGDLIAAYPADVAGHNNLALCSTYVRNIPKAIEEMQRVVAILPKRDLYRVNLALYSNYASDFETAERETRTVQAPDVKALLALAFAQLGQEQRGQASDTYGRLASLGELGASAAMSGLGDLAALEGRFSEAVAIFRRGATADLAASRPEAAAAKLNALAAAELSRGNQRAAAEAATEALRHSSSIKTRFLAARSFIEASQPAEARPLMASLASELQAEPQAYAKILEGELALKGDDPRQAVKVLTEANTLLSTWVGHFDLGRAYLALDAFPQADSEFDRCLNRRGEAMSLFLDEEPTYALFPPVYYYQGRAREGLKSEGFADSYRQYLSLRGQSSDDRLLPEVRRRIASWRASSTAQ